MRLLDQKTVDTRYSTLGYKLLEPYRASRFKHKTECLSCFYVWEITPRDIFSSHGCPSCGGVKRLTHKEVVQLLYVKGFVLVNGKYENNKSQLLLRCLKHNHTWHSSWNSISVGRGCYFCGIDKKKGDKNPAWKGGLTPENEKIRKSTKYKLWREAVFQRDKYTCQICDESDAYLEAHHILSFATYPQFRLQVDNGLTLCKTCHKNIHRKIS